MMRQDAWTPLMIDVLTPLHIGAGGPRLRHNVDYLSAAQIRIIDQERLLERLPLDELATIEDYALERLLRLVPGGAGGLARYTLTNPAGTALVPEILPLITDIRGRPYLPGSSLKGAIRTALFSSRMHFKHVRLRLNLPREPNRPANPKFADDLMDALTFSERRGDRLEPQNDPLRALRPADSAPLPETVRELVQARIFSVQNDALRPKRDHYSNQQVQFFVEALTPQTTITIPLQVDSWLLQPERAGRLGFEEAAGWLPGWIDACAAFSQAVIAHEIDFYDQYGMPGVADWYRQLSAYAQALPAGQSCLLQIAWGTGWIAKTIGSTLLDPTHAGDLERVRREYGLGRSNVSLFPKSRRLAMRADGELLPLGWVQLRTGTQPAGSSFPARAPQAQTPSREATPPPPAAPLAEGSLVVGEVVRIGLEEVFIRLSGGLGGRVRLRELSDRPVSSPHDVVQFWQRVRARVLRVPPQGPVELTMRGVPQDRLEDEQ